MGNTSGKTHPTGLTFRVAPETGLHAIFSEGARQNANVIHVVSENDTDKQWYRLHVNGWTKDHTPFMGSLPTMVEEMLGTTPQELTDPADAFLYTLGFVPSPSENLLFVVEVVTDGTRTAWRVLYNPKYNNQHGPGASLSATLIDPSTGM